ncbi:MAG: glycosyltransferase, partial [Deltaproteobacteria bacterium]|nr:glycosyltransferase [Deltaproteobacteria bacterium]
HKGLHVLIDAITLIKARPFKLIIYGDDSSPEAARYLRPLLSRSDPAGVEFRGTFPPEKISDVYAGIDVLVVPSLWHENAPLVILYARHAKIPLIVSDLGGMSEFVEHGRTGMVFPAGDSRRLAACLRFFLDHPEEIQAMRRAAKPVKTIADNVRELVEIYQHLLR